MAGKELDTDVHKVSVEELCKRFDTNIETGLTNSQVSDRLCGFSKHELNRLDSPPPTSKKVIFCKFMFLSPVTSLLWLGSIAFFVAFTIQAILYEESSVERVNRTVEAHSVIYEEYEYEGPPMEKCYIGIILCCLAIVTGGWNYYFYTISLFMTQVMAGWSPGMETNPFFIICRRNGSKKNVRNDQLFLGDILYLKAGDVVPADVRILKSTGFKVDNSKLTGESEPQLRSPHCSHDNPLETKNLAFSSTNVTSGKAVAMVVNTGKNTVHGRRAAGLATSTAMETTLSGTTQRFIIFLSVVTLIIDVVLFVVAYLFPSYNWIYAIIFLVSLMPVGVYAQIKRQFWYTTGACVDSFSISPRYDNCHIKNCYIRSYEAVGNLGSISCLLTSKTGVLTQNNPTVIHFWMDNEIIEADNYRFQEEPRSWYPLYTETPGWKILSRVASLCNSAEFEDGSIRESIWRRETIGGNWTDTAILKFCEHNMGNVMEYRDSNKMVAEIPFNSYNKYQVTIHQTEDVNDERYLVAMKGAPEIIWEKCSTILVDGEDKPITKEWKKAFEEAVSELACVEQERCGCQVIGFCDLMLPAAKYPPGFTFDPDNVEIPLQDMRFVGLMCVADPPRSAAPDTVRILRNECGIKVIMITGDHPVTALAIARTLGIVSENSKTKEEIALRNGCDVEDVETSDADAIVVTGEQLRNLVQSELVEIIENCGEIVFARISPDQRISIMEACRKLGLRVAVAGADKEDIPLLKMADVAIAMGIRGDQSAKAAADLVLLDDDIGSIARAVCLTRKLIAGKLKKFL